MRIQEPFLSRLYIAIGLLLGALTMVAWVARAGSEADWASSLLLAAIVAGAVTVVGGTLMQYRDGNRRRERFAVSREAFLALPAASPGLQTVMGLMVVGMAWAVILTGPLEEGAAVDWFFLVVAVFLTVIVGSQSILAWRPVHVGLTPQGVVWRSTVHRRLVPWEALTPGGPPLPKPLAARVTLEVARPEAVVDKGFTFFSTPRARPTITERYDVHPRLMAGAIRWYVEHPEHRPAIGTEAEHARLIAALAAQAETPGRQGR